jgi:putative redox protein
MELQILFPGDKRVVVQVGAHRIETDQPPELGGKNAAPAPYDLFLASLGSCAGIYALGFLQSRGLSTEGLAMTQRVDLDPQTHLARRVRFELTLPPGIPDKYRSAILRAVESCKVKKTLAAPPSVEVALAGDSEAG